MPMAFFVVCFYFSKWLEKLPQYYKYYHNCDPYPPPYRDLVNTRDLLLNLYLLYLLILALPMDLLRDCILQPPFNSSVFLDQLQADDRIFPPGFCNSQRSFSPGSIGDKRVRRRRTWDYDGPERKSPQEIYMQQSISVYYGIF